MTTNDPFGPFELSACCQKPVYSECGEDFGGKDDVVTCFTACTGCNNPCDLAPSDSKRLAADALLDPLFGKVDYKATKAIADYIHSQELEIKAKDAALERAAEAIRAWQKCQCTRRKCTACIIRFGNALDTITPHVPK